MSSDVLCFPSVVAVLRSFISFLFRFNNRLGLPFAWCESLCKRYVTWWIFLNIVRKAERMTNEWWKEKPKRMSKRRMQDKMRKLSNETEWTMSIEEAIATVWVYRAVHLWKRSRVGIKKANTTENTFLFDDLTSFFLIPNHLTCTSCFISLSRVTKSDYQMIMT